MSSTSPFSSGSSITDTALGNAYPVVKGVYDKLGDISYLVQNVAAITEAGRSAITSAQQAALDSNQTAQDREATELNAAQTLADRNAVENVAESFGTVQEAIDVAVAQASIASDGASVATTQASIALEQASLATLASVAAEAARDASVAAAESLGSYTTLTLASAAIASIPIDKGVYITDDGINNGFYVNRTGSLVRESTTTIPGLKAALDPIVARMRLGSSRRVPFYVRDTASRYAIWINAAGQFCISSMENVKGVIDAVVSRVNGTLKSISPRTGYALILGRDANKRVALGLSMSGHLIYRGADVHDALDPIARAAVVAQLYPSRNYVIFGDSLTEGSGTGVTGLTLGAQLQALYNATGDMRSVTSLGFGGQRGSQILARQGSSPAMVTFPVGASGFREIPASGPVSVVVDSDLLKPPNSTAVRTLTGSFYGVSGTLSRAAGGGVGVYTFTRTTAGGIVKVGPAIPFTPATADSYSLLSAVCWIGTNDLLAASPLTAAQMLSNIDTYVAYQKPHQKRRIIVMPLLDGAHANLTAQKALYAELLALVKAKYPTEYIDSVGLLQQHHDGSANDLADIAAGVVPRSMNAASDRLHLNVAGYGIIAAEIKRINDLKGI